MSALCFSRCRSSPTPCAHRLPQPPCTRAFPPPRGWATLQQQLRGPRNTAKGQSACSCRSVAARRRGTVVDVESRNTLFPRPETASLSAPGSALSGVSLHDVVCGVPVPDRHLPARERAVRVLRVRPCLSLTPCPPPPNTLPDMHADVHSPHAPGRARGRPLPSRSRTCTRTSTPLTLPDVHADVHCPHTPGRARGRPLLSRSRTCTQTALGRILKENYNLMYLGDTCT